MTRPHYPSELADKAMIRFPDGMKPILAARAKTNVRSINGEIISILTEALGFQGATAAGLGPRKANPAAVSDASALPGAASTNG